MVWISYLLAFSKPLCIFLFDEDSILVLLVSRPWSRKWRHSLDFRKCFHLRLGRSAVNHLSRIDTKNKEMKKEKKEKEYVPCDKECIPFPQGPCGAIALSLGATESIIFLLIVQIESHSNNTWFCLGPWGSMNAFNASTVIPHLLIPLNVGNRGSSSRKLRSLRLERKVYTKLTRLKSQMCTLRRSVNIQCYWGTPNSIGCLPTNGGCSPSIRWYGGTWVMPSYEWMMGGTCKVIRGG